MKQHPSRLAESLVIIPLVLLFTAACSDTRAKNAGQRIVPVKAETVIQKNVPVQIAAIGTVEAFNTVSIKALVGGEVIDVHFREGQDVKQGDLLFRIDPRPYEAALKQAEAALARDAAQAKNAEEQAKRYEILVQKDYVSRDQYDQIRANADALAAAVQADKATVENARLNLAYCTIRSPIEGRVGSVLVNKGNVVKANDAVMVAINKVRPIYVTFSVPEQNLSEIKKYMAKGRLNVAAIIPGDESQPARGVVTFVNNAVDTSTGTIQLKGTFENRDRRLWPGQFVNVLLTLTTEKDAVVMPTAAIQTGQQGQYVFIVKSDRTVESRPVTASRSFGDLTLVSKGVSPGELVVTDGQLQLIPGVRVEVKGVVQKKEDSAIQADNSGAPNGNSGSRASNLK